MAEKIGDAAVLKATGNDWKKWFALLDRAGASRLRHREIVALVGEHGAGPWWSQMVTVFWSKALGRLKEQLES